MARVTVRFFAAARASAGFGETLASVSQPATIASALAEARMSVAEAARAQFDEVVARCTFLVNEVATTDSAHPLADGDRVDVLPPFAGG